MAPTRSTVGELVVDTTGRTVFTGENVYTTSGTLARIAGTLSDYDTHGRLQKEVDVIRSVGANELKTSRTYVSSLMDTSTDADGVVTKFDYDSLLRLATKTRNWNPAEGMPRLAFPIRRPPKGTIQRRQSTRGSRCCGCDGHPQHQLTGLETEYDGAGRVKKQRARKPEVPARTTSIPPSPMKPPLLSERRCQPARTGSKRRISMAVRNPLRARRSLRFITITITTPPPQGDADQRRDISQRLGGGAV